jgi:hypothetical protein
MVCDVANYHVRVAQSDHYKLAGNILPDLKNMDYIVLLLEDGQRYAFAIKWIDPATYQIITETGNVDIRIYGVTVSEVQDILMYITNTVGAAAKVVTA